MAKTSNILSNASKGHGDEPVKKLLKKVSASLSEFKEEVDLSHELLVDTGVKTGLVAQFEKVLENPIKPLIESKKKADKNLQAVVRVMIKGLLTVASKLIDSAFILQQSKDGLCYGIVLKDDDRKNRALMFGALDAYENTEISEQVPVRFQFIPKDLVTKIKTIETVIES